MDINNDLGNSTSVALILPRNIVYPNAATEICCSFMEELLPKLEFAVISDFKTKFRTHIEQLRGDPLSYKLILNSFNEINWDFVAEDLKRRQDYVSGS